jgi:GNAT superfamily N-acetyltransferase
MQVIAEAKRGKEYKHGRSVLMFLFPRVKLPDMEKGIVVRTVAVEQIIDLRHRLLRQGLPRQSAIFTGDHDAAAIHLAAFDGDALIGCATLHRNRCEGTDAYQLRGMAVESAYQRHGVGRLLIAEAERQAWSVGMMWANCRTPAVPFYEKCGWKIVSDEFVIETAGPHFRMVKQLR